jgi:hypothetical protein
LLSIAINSAPFGQRRLQTRETGELIWLLSAGADKLLRKRTSITMTTMTAIVIKIRRIKVCPSFSIALSPLENPLSSIKKSVPYLAS